MRRRRQPCQDLGVPGKGRSKSKSSETSMSLQSGTGRRSVCQGHNNTWVSRKKWAWIDAKKIELGNLRNGRPNRPWTRVD